MNRDPSRSESSTVGTEWEPSATPTDDEVEWLSETDPEEGFSLVDPLTYAPLLLVGATLIVFPEPATTLLGVACLAAGVLLLIVDVRSSRGDND
ncbi:MAG: hypothetical protein ACOCP2_01980 [Halohasta sp.]